MRRILLMLCTMGYIVPLLSAQPATAEIERDRKKLEEERKKLSEFSDIISGGNYLYRVTNDSDSGKEATFEIEWAGALCGAGKTGLGTTTDQYKIAPDSAVYFSKPGRCYPKRVRAQVDGKEWMNYQDGGGKFAPEAHEQQRQVFYSTDDQGTWKQFIQYSPHREWRIGKARHYVYPERSEMEERWGPPVHPTIVIDKEDSLQKTK